MLKGGYAETATPGSRCWDFLWDILPYVEPCLIFGLPGLWANDAIDGASEIYSDTASIYIVR